MDGWCGFGGWVGGWIDSVKYDGYGGWNSGWMGGVGWVGGWAGK